jgi:hypothetical protein
MTPHGRHHQGPAHEEAMFNLVLSRERMWPENVARPGYFCHPRAWSGLSGTLR